MAGLGLVDMHLVEDTTAGDPENVQLGVVVQH
jgi:hypothetical protein